MCSLHCRDGFPQMHLNFCCVTGAVLVLVFKMTINHVIMFPMTYVVAEDGSIVNFIWLILDTFLCCNGLRTLSSCFMFSAKSVEEVVSFFLIRKREVQWNAAETGKLPTAHGDLRWRVVSCDALLFDLRSIKFSMMNSFWMSVWDWVTLQLRETLYQAIAVDLP